MKNPSGLANERIPLLKWTGHPLVDVGMATLCAIAKKESPEELTVDDLDRAADLMADYYFSGLMTSYNSCVFTMNAYDNPAFKSEESTKSQEYEEKFLRAHRTSPNAEATGLKCPFSGKPATHLIERRQMPLLTGEGVINFYPAVRGFLPIHGTCLVALQALPLGGRRTEGRLLIAHADEPELTLEFARKYLADNQRLLNLAKSGALPKTAGPADDLEREQAAGRGKSHFKYPDAKAPISLIANDLMDIFRTRGSTRFGDRRDISLTVYWLSNSGQGAALDIFHIPFQLTRFLRSAEAAPLGHGWRKLVHDAWRSPSKQKKDSSGVTGGPGRSRNDVLADLFAIYESGFMDARASKRFLQRHLLRAGRKLAPDRIASQFGTGSMNWPLTELFLREVMGMDESRIVAIKGFADRLASHIRESNDRTLFRNLVYAQRPWEVRNALTKAQRNQAKDRATLLFGLEEYVKVFEAEDAVGRGDWSLTRDLISIRLVEELYRQGFFEKENADLLSEPESAEEAL
jgi:CRISPR-associated protein Cst1